MKTEEQKVQSQQLTDEEFILGEPEITLDEENSVPKQDDITLQESKAPSDKPIIQSEEESKKEDKSSQDTAEINAEQDVSPSASEKESDEIIPEEEKLDFVKVMRENNLEVFTKELFTDEVSDEDFANQLLKDKYFGRQSYTKEIDAGKAYEFYPKEISEEVEVMKQDIARRIANASPDDKAKLGEMAGSDESIYNEYLSMANNNIGKMAAISAAVGAVVAAPAVGAVATAGAFAAGTLAAFGSLYTTAEIVNSADRAMRTSPEDIEALNKTQEDKQGLIYLADEYIPNAITPKIIEMLVREKDDTPVERYAKEFTSVAIDTFGLGALFKGAKVLGKGGSKASMVLRRTSKRATEQAEEFSETVEKLNDFIRVQKSVKEQNKRIVQARQSFDEIIERYESVTPPIPVDAAAKTIDHDRLAGEAYDKFIKSKYTDDNAFEAFNYHTAKGSKHNLGTVRTAELSKDASEAELSKIANPEKFGKGSRGTGTDTMDLANKIDEIGEQRLKAIKKGDLLLDSKLEKMQDTLMQRVDVMATKQGGSLQEINRSMPLRRSMITQYNRQKEIALELNRSGLRKRYRTQLEREFEKNARYLERLQTSAKGATTEELLAMGVANTIYSNMLGGAAVPKAALGGLISTGTNAANLIAKGVSPKQVFKLQVNSAKQLADDIRKIDLSQLKSDIATGSINNRFKVKRAADLTEQSTDSVTKKTLKKVNKGINVIAAPIQGGLGSVDYLIDTFNSRSRVAETWLDYVTKQKKLGRTDEELLMEVDQLLSDPTKLSTTFNNEVLRAAEEGLATDKMMLSKAHSKGYMLSKPAWAIDKAFNATTENLMLNTTLKFVNPFTRTSASMLDSIAENTAIGMFRTSADNGIIAKITPRQMLGTAASFGLFHGIANDLTSVPQSAEMTAGSFGLRNGIQVGGHNFPIEVLGVYGEAIEKFMVLEHAMEAASIEGVDTSNIAPIMGGLLEVTTAYGMAENLKSIAQSILNVPEGRSKVEVSKMIEQFMPAGYLLKGAADVTDGALASNPYLGQVFGAFNAEFGNAKVRDAFGTPISEGENLELDRSFVWTIDRKGEDKAGLELKKKLLDAGVWSSQKLAGFRTDDGFIPYSSIKINGSYDTFSATMTPLTNSITIGGKGVDGKGRNIKVSSATKNKALGIMFLEKKTMENIINEEITNLNNMEADSPEAKFLRNQAKTNLRNLAKGADRMLRDLAQYGMNKTLPKTLNMLMDKDAPNITSKFDRKKYAVLNLMRYNKEMFNGDLKKQKEFFTRVNRVKDTVLFYNAVKQLGKQFMQNSAEAVNAEIQRINYVKSK